MKKSSKAALLSGLLFPGVGHVFLKEYMRGAALIVASLAAVYVISATAYEEAQLVVDQIMNGEVPIESAAITQAVADASSAEGSLISNVAAIVLIACWLAGIIDSYRIGAAQERQTS